MKGPIETWLICAAALALGTALGPLVSGKRRYTAQPVAPSHSELASAPSQLSNPSARTIVSVPLSTGHPVVSPVGSAPPALRPVTPDRLSPSAVETLANQCASTEPAEALVAISRVESGFHPLRIRVNGRRGRSYDPTSDEEAVRLASSLIVSGESVDLGLAQINSHNLAWLNLTVEGAFDPCRNLAAAGEVLAQGYRAALKESAQGQSLLHTAYSLYNTGDPVRGIANGYADRVQMRRASR